MSLEESISSPLSTPTIAIGKDRPSVSRKDLLSATTDRGVFDKIYIDLTNRCIKAYQTSKRKRCALKLYASLAALESYVLIPSSCSVADRCETEIALVQRNRSSSTHLYPLTTSTIAGRSSSRRSCRNVSLFSKRSTCQRSDC